MDKTTSTSSTSVMADSASAAATSKTAGLGASATSVKLLIKASNQQYDDQIIESDMMWTVQRLKTHLSLVYPNKPPVAEQKLIYSGQLLNDKLQLKDVIRSYKDVYTHNHIFHLVYTPKHPPMMNNNSNSTKKCKMNSSASTTSASNSNGDTSNCTTTTTDGLRQRNVPVSVLQGQQQEQQIYPQLQEVPVYATSAQIMAHWLAAAQAQGSGPCPPNNATGDNIDTARLDMLRHFQATQQAAMYSWMHQVYSQYMSQFLRVTNMNGDQMSQMNATSFGDTGSDGATGIGYPFFPNIPFAMNENGAGSPMVGNVHPVIPSFPSATSPVAETSTASGREIPQPAQAQPVQPAAQAEPQMAAPRFPNIVQEEGDNRDWLDRFFSVTRLAIFLTILYFNSSPLRCLFVVIIAGTIYLYHIGVLRFNRERNNNNINRNNNAAAVAEADQIRQGVQQVQEAQAAQEQQHERQVESNPTDEAHNNNNNNSATDAETAQGESAGTERLPGATSATSDENARLVVDEDRENSGSSMISFVRTFVVTFFTSLLPETAAL